MVPEKHKVFISYYHDADQAYADELRNFYEDAIIDRSIYDDIGHLKNETILDKIKFEHLKDSTVTVVLVGKHTWGRKWVDWEINASLRPYGERTRNGLVGVYLPGHSRKHFRLTDNINSGYAVKIKWEDLRRDLKRAIHQAWNRRNRPELINNSRPIRKNNAPLEPKDYSVNKGNVIEKNNNCFIATAAYGTPYAYEINILRQWRDSRLKNTIYGVWLIRNYYKFSPRIANFIKTKKRLRLMIIMLLDGLIKIFQSVR